MKPSIGRIVIFTGLVSNNSNEHPAIINRVWSDVCVNLTVFPDCDVPICKTTVILDPNGGDNTWHWPVIVK